MRNDEVSTVLILSTSRAKKLSIQEWYHCFLETLALVFNTSLHLKVRWQVFFALNQVVVVHAISLRGLDMNPAFRPQRYFPGHPGILRPDKIHISTSPLSFSDMSKNGQFGEAAEACMITKVNPTSQQGCVACVTLNGVADHQLGPMASPSYKCMEAGWIRISLSFHPSLLCFALWSVCASPHDQSGSSPHYSTRIHFRVWH